MSTEFCLSGAGVVSLTLLETQHLESRETSGSGVQGCSQIHSESKVSLHYRTPRLLNKNQIKQKQSYFPILNKRNEGSCVKT